MCVSTIYSLTFLGNSYLKVFEGNSYSTLNYYVLVPFYVEIEFTYNIYKFKVCNLVVLFYLQILATSTTIKL